MDGRSGERSGPGLQIHPQRERAVPIGWFLPGLLREMTFPRYELIELLSSGSASKVWRAYRKDLDFPCALKVFAPNPEWDPAEACDWQALFMNEAAVLAWLQHSSILRFYDLAYGTAGEVALVTEYVNGKSLEQIQKPLASDIAGMIAVRILGAIRYLQRPLQIGKRNYNAIVHGDIKPGNIMIAEDGVRLVDFGFSCPDPDLDSKYILGSNKYVSPQRLAGRKACWLDDTYSLAASLLDKMGMDPNIELSRSEKQDPILKVFDGMLRDEFQNLTSLIDSLELELGEHNYGPKIAALLMSPPGG